MMKFRWRESNCTQAADTFGAILRKLHFTFSWSISERLYELKISQLDQKVSSYEQLVAKLQYESAVKDATLDEHAGRIAALEEENERYRNKLQALIQENNNVDAAHDGREDVVNDGEISDKKLLYNRPATPFDKQGLTKRNSE